MSATIARVLVWLVILGFVTAGLTVCSGPVATLVPPPTEGEVAAVPSPTPSGATDTPPPPSPTPAPETTDTPPSPTDTPVPPSPTPPPPTDTPVSPTDTPEPEPEPEEASPTDTPEPEPEPEVDVASLSSDNCLGCHTDQETLEALAEEKEVESEASSGEG
jgi:outer membrane biosynthesis protein TonB